jgi:hypothetical protein
MSSVSEEGFFKKTGGDTGRLRRKPGNGVLFCSEFGKDADGGLWNCGRRVRVGVGVGTLRGQRRAGGKGCRTGEVREAENGRIYGPADR